MEKRSHLIKWSSRASVSVALTLTLLKSYAIYTTHSLSILSSLLDSVMDMLASIATLVAVTIANRPADRSFRFGYGKLEAVAALSQSILILISVLFLIFEAIQQLFSNSHHVAYSITGIIVMGVSIALTLALNAFQQYVIRQTNSIAVKADALHYKTDIAVNAAVLISLYLSQYYANIDSISCLGVSIYILWATKEILSDSLSILLDKEINDSERNEIINIIMNHPNVLGLHNFRTRTSGHRIFVEVHIEMNPELTLVAAHDIAHDVKNSVESKFPNADVIIHQDPAGYD